MMRLTYRSPPVDILRIALPEAIAWAKRASMRPSVTLAVDEPDPGLRTIRIAPRWFSSDMRETVFSVVDHRWYALGCPDRNRLPGAAKEGRLLYYEPDLNLADGAACAASSGFFDIDNVPPWDTWLCFADDRFLVSWVPSTLVAMAAAGIHVNPECCILWPEDVDTPFSRVLSEEGLLQRAG